MASESQVETKTTNAGSYVLVASTMVLITAVAARLLFTEKRVSELETDVDIVKTILSGQSSPHAQQSQNSKQKSRGKQTKEKPTEQQCNRTNL